MSPTTNGQRKLSEVAKHLVLPSGIVSTGWPAVREKCRDLGLGFDLWQDGLGRCTLAKRADGLYAATVGGVVISIPRQVGKTYLIGAIVFALCLLHPGITVIWTAHRVKTAAEVFGSMQAMAKRKKIAPLIEAVPRGSGDEAVLFTNGSRILFGARERGFGRGFAKLSIVVLDECQILTESTLDDMVPAMNTGDNPLLIMTGTPPKPKDNGEVFATRRREALAGQSDDMVYVEVSAKPAIDPTTWPVGHVDWDAVAEANPSYPLRTPRSSILRMLRQLGRESFRREGLGIWDEDAGSRGVILKSDWSACQTSAAIVGTPTLALDVSPMLTHSGIVAAGLTADGRVGVEVTSDGATLLDYREGVEWAIELLTTAQATVWMAPGSAADAIRPRLETGGCVVHVMERAAYARGCVNFAAAVASKRVAHLGQAELDRHVPAGAKRAADEGLWVWGRVKSSSDITLLVAATVAFAVADDADYDVEDSVG